MNNKERTLLQQCAGTARFTWNWGLAKWIKRYQDSTGTQRFTDAFKLHRELNRLKKTEFKWMYNFSKCIPQEALRNLEVAFKNFLKGQKDRRKVGFPKFKKKGKSKDSFRLTGRIYVFAEEKRVQLPRLGKLRLKEKPNLATSFRILNATVSKTADRWYVSLTIEEIQQSVIPTVCEPLGIDTGLKAFITTSDGFFVPPPKFIQKRMKKFRNLSRAHPRKKIGGRNRKKSALKLARLHQKIANIRKDYLHKMSTYLAKNHGVLVMENLNVKELAQNRSQAKNWYDLSHGEFKRYLSYKVKWFGSKLVEAPRFFPSSKMCSNCLWINENLTLKDRVFNCQLCGLSINRDLNAALNLEHYYYWYLQKFQSSELNVAVSSPETLNACGEAVGPQQLRQDSVNQEIGLSSEFFKTK